MTDTDLLTATQAAHLASTWRHIASGGGAATVGLSAISNWTRRGHLQAAGLTPQGRKLYRTADLARAERATRSHALRVRPRPEPEGTDMPIRAKFVCTGFDTDNDRTGRRSYEFTAMYDPDQPEDQRYAKATPTGSLKMTVDNEAVRFEPGQAYYLDITPADDQPAAASA